MSHISLNNGRIWTQLTAMESLCIELHFLYWSLCCPTYRSGSGSRCRSGDWLHIPVLLNVDPKQFLLQQSVCIELYYERVEYLCLMAKEYAAQVTWLRNNTARNSSSSCRGTENGSITCSYKALCRCPMRLLLSTRSFWHTQDKNLHIASGHYLTFRNINYLHGHRGFGKFEYPHSISHASKVASVTFFHKWRQFDLDKQVLLKALHWAEKFA